jgi:uncharacterized protein (DUF3084 family)
MEKERKKGRESRLKEGKENREEDIMNYLQTEEEVQLEATLNNFGEVGKFSLSKLERIIEENKEKLEEGIKEHEAEELPQTGLTAAQAPEEASPTRAKQSTEDKELKNLKTQNDKYEAQLKALKIQLSNLQTVEKQIEEEKQSLAEKKKSVQENFIEVKSNYTEI